MIDILVSRNSAIPADRSSLSAKAPSLNGSDQAARNETRALQQLESTAGAALLDTTHREPMQLSGGGQVALSPPAVNGLPTSQAIRLSELLQLRVDAVDADRAFGAFGALVDRAGQLAERYPHGNVPLQALAAVQLHAMELVDALGEDAATRLRSGEPPRSQTLSQDPGERSAEQGRSVAAVDGNNPLSWFKTGSEYTFLLQIVAVLMQLAASQNRQSADMLNVSQMAVIESGHRMVSSAKERLTGAIVGFSVGLALAGAAVLAGAWAAKKNIASLKKNDKAGNDADEFAQGLKLQAKKDLATGQNKQSEAYQKQMALANNKRTEAATAHAKHAVVTTQMAVVTQTSHAVGQVSNSGSQIAASEYDVRAAEHNREKELYSQMSTAAKQVSETTASEKKKDEAEQAQALQTFRETVRQLVEASSEMIRHF